MTKFYTINELKKLENELGDELSVIDFFNLPTKLSKSKYENNFKEKYDKFFIKDLTLQQMRRYYNDNVYKFYIDNYNEIKNNNNIFFDFINTLDTNTKKSLTRNTIKSTYSLVYDSFIKNTENKQDIELKFSNNEKYFMDGIIKGSSFKNKLDIEKKIIEYLGKEAIKDYNDGCKLTYIIKKYFYNENIKYRCYTCDKPIGAYSSDFKECLECHLALKQKRENEKRANYILNNIPEHINFIGGEFYTSDFYNEQYKIFCKKCKKEHNYEFKSDKRIFKCPSCDAKQKINHQINSLFNNTFRVNSKTFIKPKEIDLINHKNKLCVEYNGIMFHSHGVSEHKKFNNPIIDSEYHLRKTNLVEEKGYQLFHIFENEWLDLSKQKIWISMINNKLGKSNKIYARKCILKEVNLKDSKEYLKNNHLQGNCLSTIRLGLYYADELISLMTFRKHIQYDWEMVRFANKINITVIGAASKLLKYFELKYKPKTLLSYANRRWSRGDMYETLGFDIDGNTNPNYFYFNTKEKILYSGENFKIYKSNKKCGIYTENEITNMFNDGYRIIFDCGNKKYVKYYNTENKNLFNLKNKGSKMHHCEYSEKDLNILSEIHKFLTENGIEYSNEYGNFCLNFGNPDGKRSYEICYVNSENYPITYDKYGIDGVSSDYFYKLSYKAEQEDNSFICWVKDYEWNDHRKREVLKSYWLYAAGKIKNKFYARDCEVREVNSKEAREFESEHCFYGKRGASLNLGLYTIKEKNGIPAGTLIMLYTFGKNFFGKDNSIEVLRVGTMKNCTVTGGASKLLNYFLTNYKTIKIGKNNVPVEKLKFYSDYDHNIGSSMEQLGFNFINYSKGGFMNLWVETGEVKHREPKNHKLIMEKMKEGLVLAIPNAGVKTFEYIIDNEH